MTKRECAIIMAYTGTTMLTGEDFEIFHKYIEHILGRPVYTHELGNKNVWDEIKEKSKNDFLDICKNSINTHGEDALVCALEEAKQLYTKLTVRCDNDNIRVGDVNRVFRIYNLIETVLSKEAADE